MVIRFRCNFSFLVFRLWATDNKEWTLFMVIRFRWYFSFTVSHCGQRIQLTIIHTTIHTFFSQFPIVGNGYTGYIPGKRDGEAGLGKAPWKIFANHFNNEVEKVEYRSVGFIAYSWNRFQNKTRKEVEFSTVTPRNNGRQGTNKFHLLLADFCYCQYRKLKEMIWRDQGVSFVIGAFPLLLGPVLRGLTVQNFFRS